MALYCKAISCFHSISNSALVVVVRGEVDVDLAAVLAAVPLVHVVAVVVSVVGERRDGVASNVDLSLVVKRFRIPHNALFEFRCFAKKLFHVSFEKYLSQSPAFIVLVVGDRHDVDNSAVAFVVGGGPLFVARLRFGQTVLVSTWFWIKFLTTTSVSVLVFQIYPVLVFMPKFCFSFPNAQ